MWLWSCEYNLDYKLLGWPTINELVRLYRVLGERLRNTTALSRNIQILINLNIITTLHELHFVGNGSIYVSKSCRHANHNKLIELGTLKMVYKSVNDQAPTYLAAMFVKLSDSSKRELRNTKTDLAVPRCKSAFGQKCFSYKGAKLWNDLSTKVKHPKRTKYSKNVSATSAVNASSLFACYDLHYFNLCIRKYCK